MKRALLISVFLLAACGPAPEAAEPTLTSLQEELFSPSCSNSVCHGGPNPVRGLRLDTAAETRAQLVDVAGTNGDLYVVAGSPSESLLLQVLQGSVDSIRQMPPGLEIDAEIVAAVEQWIDDGALDN